MVFNGELNGKVHRKMCKLILSQKLPGVIDLDLYGRIDGIETSRQIRSRFGVPDYLCLNYDSKDMISQILN